MSFCKRPDFETVFSPSQVMQLRTELLVGWPQAVVIWTVKPAQRTLLASVPKPDLLAAVGDAIIDRRTGTESLAAVKRIVGAAQLTPN